MLKVRVICSRPSFYCKEVRVLLYSPSPTLHVNFIFMIIYFFVVVGVVFTLTLLVPGLLFYTKINIKLVREF